MCMNVLQATRWFTFLFKIDNYQNTVFLVNNVRVKSNSCRFVIFCRLSVAVSIFGFLLNNVYIISVLSDYFGKGSHNNGVQ